METVSYFVQDSVYRKIYWKVIFSSTKPKSTVMHACNECCSWTSVVFEAEYNTVVVRGDSAMTGNKWDTIKNISNKKKKNICHIQFSFRCRIGCVRSISAIEIDFCYNKQFQKLKWLLSFCTHSFQTLWTRIKRKRSKKKNTN